MNDEVDEVDSMEAELAQIVVRSMDEAQALNLSYPLEVRPVFTLNGQGFGIAYDRLALIGLVGIGLEASPTSEVLITVHGTDEGEVAAMNDAALVRQMRTALEQIELEVRGLSTAERRAYLLEIVHRVRVIARAALNGEVGQ